MKIDVDRVETVTPQTLIGDLVLFHPEAAELLFSIGLHCLGCPSSGVETVSDAADVHGLDTEKLVSQLNDIIKVYHRHFYLNTYIVWTLLFCGSDVFIIYRIANVFLSYHTSENKNRDISVSPANIFIGMEKDYDSVSMERTVIHLHILILLILSKR